MDNNIEISDDKTRLDVDMIHEFLQTSYWANTRTKEEVIETIKNSDCYGLFFENKQIGFARVLTDRVAFAYLMDVFVLKEYNGNGYAQKLLSEIMNKVAYKKVKKWLLKTKDAHQLYEKFGFVNLEQPEKYMVINQK